MRRRIVVSAVIAVSAAVASAGPIASAEPGRAPSAMLVLSAAHTSSAVVTVPATIRSGTPFDPLSVTTKGRMAGFLISDVHGIPLLGRLVVRGVGLDPDEALPLWFTDGKDLRPGRYRVTVIADAPAVVRVPLTGSRSRTVKVTGPAHVFSRFANSTIPSAGPAGAPVGRVQIPVPPGRYHLAALFDFMRGFASQASGDSQCITTTPSCAIADGSGSQGWFLTPGNGGSGTGSAGTAFTPADVASGSQAVFENVDAGLSGAYAGLVLLFA